MLLYEVVGFLMFASNNPRLFIAVVYAEFTSRMPKPDAGCVLWSP